MFLYFQNLNIDEINETMTSIKRDVSQHGITTLNVILIIVYYSNGISTQVEGVDYIDYIIGIVEVESNKLCLLNYIEICFYEIITRYFPLIICFENLRG